MKIAICAEGAIAQVASPIAGAAVSLKGAAPDGRGTSIVVPASRREPAADLAGRAFQLGLQPLALQPEPALAPREPVAGIEQLLGGGVGVADPQVGVDQDHRLVHVIEDRRERGDLRPQVAEQVVHPHGVPEMRHQLLEHRELARVELRLAGSAREEQHVRGVPDALHIAQDHVMDSLAPDEVTAHGIAAPGPHRRSRGVDRAARWSAPSASLSA